MESSSLKLAEVVNTLFEMIDNRDIEIEQLRNEKGLPPKTEELLNLKETILLRINDLESDLSLLRDLLLDNTRVYHENSGILRASMIKNMMMVNENYKEEVLYKAKAFYCLFLNKKID